LASKDEKRLEGALPVITDLAIRIMNDYNDLRERTQEDARLASMEEDTEDEVAVREEARMDREFALGELLRIAVGMDYGDENGRRKMFQLISKFNAT
jgi:condensin complex subunit 3